MNPTLKMLVIAVSAAVVGGGLVVVGMKVAAPAKSVAPTATVAKADEQGAPAEQPKVAAKDAPKAPTKPATAPAPAAGGSATDAQLRALITSSAWCSFSYNQYSGSSSTTRYVYSANGTFSSNGQGETYNSGDAGSYAGQSNTSGGGQWKIQNMRLFISSAETGYQMVDVNAALTQNSNGYPIITVGGTEYTQC